jgi:hypothetical protein
MGQIVNYWQRPQSIGFGVDDEYQQNGLAFDVGSGTYGFPRFGELTSQLSALSYSGDQDEEAYLCFGLGVKLEMSYGLAGSGAYQSRAASVYRDDLRYGSATYVHTGRTPWNEIRPKVIANVKKGWPVHVAIRKTGRSGGHSVVFDGYRTDGYLHVNMGWGGSSDAWYDVPSISGYDVVSEVVYDIFPDAGWSQYGADGRNTFRTIYDVPESAPTTTKWSYRCWDRYEYEGVIVGASGDVFATVSPMDKQQGHLCGLWHFDRYGSRIESWYFSGEQGNVSPPVEVADGHVVVTGEDGGAYFVNTRTKDVTNRTPGGGSNYLPKAGADGNVYFCSDDKVFCYAANGTWKWSFPLPSGYRCYPNNLPAIENGRNNVYVTCYSSAQQTAILLCLDSVSGVERYRKEFTGLQYQSRSAGNPSIGDDGTVFLGVYKWLYAFTPGSSAFTTKWGPLETNSKLRDCTPVLGKNGRAYVFYWKQVGSIWYYNLAAVSQETGSVLWEKQPMASPGDSDNMLQPYIGANGLVMFYFLREQPGTDSYELYAYRDQGSYAEEAWHISVPSPAKATLGWGPGDVIYTMQGNTLYALTSYPHGMDELGGEGYQDNRPPTVPASPSPANGAVGVTATPRRNGTETVTISWTTSDPDDHSVACDVSFGRPDDGVLPVVGIQVVGNSLEVEVESGQTYAWSVRASDGQAPVFGEAWYFTTDAPEGIVERSFPVGCCAPGNTVDVSIAMDFGSVGTVTSLVIAETLPAGWQFRRVVSVPAPPIVPVMGATGTIEFSWVEIPAFPFPFTYEVAIPDAEPFGLYCFAGTTAYRTGGPELTMPISGEACIDVGACCVPHQADQNDDWIVQLSPELTRLIQFYNSGGYHCQAGTEDGYAPGPPGADPADTACGPHQADQNGDWRIQLSPELTRLIQFYNSGGYHCQEGTEDGYMPGLPGKAMGTLPPGKLTAARSVCQAGYAPGAHVDVCLEVDHSGPREVTSLAAFETLPSGWRFVGLVDTPPLLVQPAPGSAGTLEFAWGTMPSAWPVRLAYRVLVPEGASGSQPIPGTVSFREDAGEITVITPTTLMVRAPGSGAASAVEPNGAFVAVVEAARGADGKGLWDLTGTYTARVKGDLLTLNLVHDAKGRLTGDAAYALGSGAVVTMPIRGRVRGLSGHVTMKGSLRAADAGAAANVALTLSLALDPANRELLGPLTGTVRSDGLATRMNEDIALAIRAPMDGSWGLALQLAQVRGEVTGEAVLTLSNGVIQVLAVSGHAFGKTAALTLSSAPADPAAGAIRGKAAITPLEDGSARLDSFSGKGYGQTLAW